VDNSFQTHPDLKTIHENEFKILYSAIGEIKKIKTHKAEQLQLLELRAVKKHILQ